MIKQDILEKQVKSSYLAIGSNLGDKYANIEQAKNLLIHNNILIENFSSYFETPSWPNRKFPNFLNIVIKIKTKLTLKDLFILIKKIEKTIGRKNAPKNYPRICDIDIIDFKGLSLKTELPLDISISDKLFFVIDFESKSIMSIIFLSIFVIFLIA